MSKTFGQQNGKIYLIAGKRTPFGKFGGSLKDITPVDLAVLATKGLLEDSKISPDKIDQVILGNVVTSSTDTMYGGRHLALKIGCQQTTPGITINRLCGSGIEAIIMAAKEIELGHSSCVLASGTENMSMAPHLVYGGRFGTKYGQLKSGDMLLDALTDQYAQTPMGITAENLASKFNVTRGHCDEFAFNSHQKANKAYEQGLIQGELVTVQLKKTQVIRDEHLRSDSTIDEMAKLSPTFKKDGVVTAASASGVVDGASSVLVANEKFCQQHGISPIAEIISSEVIGVDPTIMGIGPSPAIKNLLQKTNLKMDQIDFFELNEAFAGQALSCLSDLKLPQEKVNIWGGAIALGHPLAASGTRITYTLARQLAHHKKKYGIASACIGGGQGVAILIKNVSNT